MRRLTILVDMDGVLVDTLPTWLFEYNSISGDRLKVSDITEYDHAQFARNPDLFWKALSTGDVFRRASPMSMAVEGMRYLNTQHDVRIVSYVHESVRDGHRQKLDWIQHYMPFIGPDQFVFTRQKHLVSGDIMIEDSIENLVRWCEADESGERRPVIMNQPYNQDVPAYLYGTPRVRDMMEFIEQLQEGRI